VFTINACTLSLSLMLLTGHPLNALFHFTFLILNTVGRTPLTGDQPVARPLPTHRINADIHTLSGIRTKDPIVRAGEDSAWLRPRGQWSAILVLLCLYYLLL
jgi:hypothetical protein